MSEIYGADLKFLAFIVASQTLLRSSYLSQVNGFAKNSQLMLLRRKNGLLTSMDPELVPKVPYTVKCEVKLHGRHLSKCIGRALMVNFWIPNLFLPCSVMLNYIK